MTDRAGAMSDVIRRNDTSVGNKYQHPRSARRTVTEDIDPQYSISPQLIAIELKWRGIDVTWLRRNFFLANVAGRQFGYWITSTHQTGRAGAFAAARKDISRRLLAGAGLGIAEGRLFEREEAGAATSYAMELGDAVVKPAAGRKGQGVTVGVRTAAQFGQAWERAARETGLGIIVERRFAGEEARFLVVGDRCVSVIRRIAPHVVGNGENTVRQLIDEKNRERSLNPAAANYPIIMNEQRKDRLREQGFELDDTPPNGVRVVLDLKAGLSSGAETCDATDEVHPSYLDLALRARAALPGLDIAGIDIIAEDFGRPAKISDYIVCEVNTGPGIGSNHFPMTGRPRDVAGAIVDLHIDEKVERPSHSGRRPTGQPSVVNTTETFPPATQVELGQFYDISAQLIAIELMRRGIEVSWLTHEFFIADVAGYRLGYWSTSTHTTGCAGVKAATRKDLSRRLLSAAGLPIARGGTFRKNEKDQAAEYARSLDVAVIKPLDRRMSRGLSVGVRTADEFERAWHIAASSTDRQILVEQQFSGQEASLLVVGERFIAATFEGADITDKVHVSLRDVAVQARHTFPGLDIARVDIIAQDLSQPPSDENYIICEVDSRPDIAPFHFPTEGEPRDAAGAIVDMHLGELQTTP